MPKQIKCNECEWEGTEDILGSDFGYDIDNGDYWYSNWVCPSCQQMPSSLDDGYTTLEL